MKLYLPLLFIWAKINAAGATLLPSTHYAELLDQFQRNDCIYIARNINGISIENLSKILNRNDIKKNDAYQSDFLKGTAPKYDAYIALKNKPLSNGEKKTVKLSKIIVRFTKTNLFK